jgi:FixJ family two-component response regulator
MPRGMGAEPDESGVAGCGSAVYATGQSMRMSEDERRVVCVVDDDASLRRSLRNLLMSVGFRVETFASAEAFLDSVRPRNAGCMVLDLRMAGMSGLELLRHLAATGSRIPVVMLTAHGDDETRQRSLQAGAVAFLTKPFPSAALVDAVRSALSTA